MIKTITNLFKGKEKKIEEYTGLSDFFLHAPIDQKKKVITEAAQKANEDQLETFNKTRFSMRAR